jgi:tryptophanyl-tRNA synthetase
MAADILIHRVNAVPVGDDQTQHLELTRDLVVRFNGRFGELFPLPERITPELGARVMSLQNPSAKMSKTDPDPDSYIGLTEDPETTRRKVMGAVTDSDRKVRYDWDEKPGISNLLELMSFSSGRPIPELESEFGDAGYGPFKKAVAEAVVERLAPIRGRFKRTEDAEVARLMQKAALDARTRAEATMRLVRKAVGLGAN